jgi:serine/threonine protein kinase
MAISRRYFSIYSISAQVPSDSFLALNQSNVLIDDTGKAVLCDFGLSVVKTGDNTSSTQVFSGEVMGSLNWMAPERLERGGSV